MLIELTNTLDNNLSDSVKVSQNPIEIFKSLLETPNPDFQIGYDEIIESGKNRVIRGFRLLHSGVLYGPIDVADLEKIKSSEYLEASKITHEALEKLKSGGLLDIGIEIPVEYNVRGRTWRQFYEGTELATLASTTDAFLQNVLEGHSKTVADLEKAGLPAKKLKKYKCVKEEIKERTERLRKLYGTITENELQVYHEKIDRTLEALWKMYGIRNSDYHEHNVIINRRNGIITLIDGYWVIPNLSKKTNINELPIKS